MTDVRSTDLVKALDYADILYYELEGDKFNAIKKAR